MPTPSQPPSRPTTLAEARDWLDTLTPEALPERLRLRPGETVTDRARFLDWLRGGLAALGPDGLPVPHTWCENAKRDARILFSALYPDAG